MYRGFVRTVFVVAGLGLAGQARAATISNYSIFTAVPGASCGMSGSGPATASCHSPGEFPNDAYASATLTDNSLQLSAGGAAFGGGSASASLTHDDLYVVPVNGPVSALLSLTCYEMGYTPTAHFSLGSTNVSPPVETIFEGASQGSGECGRTEFKPMPPDFVVSLVAMNNIVELHTSIDAVIFLTSDVHGSVFVQLTVDGFQDANGNPITATLVPEPGAWLTLGLGLLIVAGLKRLST